MLEAARGFDFKVRPLGIRRRVRLGERRALIELVDLEGQEEFCTRLERSLSRPGAVPRIAPHVTLFTEPGGGGIGLYSADQLETLSQNVDLRLEPGPWRLEEDGAILGA